MAMIYSEDKLNDTVTESLSQIETLIYQIRGKKIILGPDLARLYVVTTFNLNKAVRRNLSRFPDDFMFQLTNQEVRDLKFQSGISSLNTHGGTRITPYAFTQEGVAMLSSVLRSEHAVRVNIAIMRAFVKLKSLLTDHDLLIRRMDALQEKYDGQFEAVFVAIRELMSEQSVPRKRIIGIGKSSDS
jgi:flagellar capping protein FliD